MCPSAPRVCSEPGGQKPVLSLSLDRIGWPLKISKWTNKRSTIFGVYNTNFAVTASYIHIYKTSSQWYYDTNSHFHHRHCKSQAMARYKYYWCVHQRSFLFPYSDHGRKILLQKSFKAKVSGLLNDTTFFNPCADFILGNIKVCVFYHFSTLERVLIVEILLAWQSTIKILT